MATLFARRKPKRVGKDDFQSARDEDDQDTGPVVRRPASNAPKNKSKLRISFDPTDSEVQQQDEQGSDTVGVKRPHAAVRSAPSQNVLSTRAEPERPTYNKDYLTELRNSTPSTPKDQLSAYASSAEDEEAATNALDVARKFGASRISSSHIPSAAEIQEKKERRARLAKEQGAEDFIALEDYDSDGEFKPQRMQVSKFYTEDLTKNTRLVRDDEDIAEGFDDFVEDSGRVTLSRKMKRLQDRKDKEALRELIADAENSSSDSDSSAERNDAYVAAQTSHGMDGLTSHRVKVVPKPKPPKDFAPIPKISDVLARLRRSVQALEFEKVRLEKRKADIQNERLDVVARQEHIQTLLSEAGEKFEELRNGGKKTQGNGMDGVLNGSGDGAPLERGLESLASTPGPSGT